MPIREISLQPERSPVHPVSDFREGVVWAWWTDGQMEILVSNIGLLDIMSAMFLNTQQ